MKKEQNLITGNVLSTLVKFTIPILLSMLLQIAYGTADLFIVGQFSDVANVSGVSIGSQLTQVFTNFCVGLSMGTTVLIGKYMGKNQDDKAGEIAGVSIYIFGVLSVICTIIMIGLSGVLIRLMQAPAESYELAKSYLMITGVGCIFIVAYNLLGSIFRGIGDSKTPLLAVAMACVLNIILDLILVAGLNMGANGAAIATVFAQGVSVLISVLVICKRGLPFTIKKSYITYKKEIILKIMAIGIPSAMQMILANFSFLVISSILNSLGVAASAAVGIVSKITSFILIMPLAFGQSLSAFTAQNLGANKKERAVQGLIWAIIISIIYGIFSGYFSYFHGTIFTNMFNPDQATTLAAVDYLRAYAIDSLLVAFTFSLHGYFNGCGKTTFVMLNSSVAAFLIRIPLSYYFSTLGTGSLFLVGLAIPISTFVQLVVGFIYLRIHSKKVIDKTVS